jgi:outer membrane protein assembly factor BamD (BamD/ComL family)
VDARRRHELEYRSRFPAGALAQEADLAILEVRLRLGPSSNALRAAGRFLEHWPASEHAAEVTAIRGVLRQRGGDCAGALGDFDRALAARVSAGRREEALFGRASCLEAAGRTADAASAYQAYLRERPDGRFAARAREALDAIRDP